ncbi:MAG: lipopolysaccharide core heptose(I) kinase RfaP [Gammaproteobacteria bacterium]|nr:lipopolysaccharide core heptose(I) kinase RfaP [Gammaproteobacteria bacterium]
MKPVVTGELARAWAGCDPFVEVTRLEGEIYRALEGRRTLRFELAGRAYFAKIHRGIGWREVAKNLLRLRLPVLGAQREWRAIHRLQELGVATLTPVAFGQRGRNPARRLSFLVTEALEPSVDLETFCARGGLAALGLAERRALIRKLATITRTLHESGVNHRDYYLCHFLLDASPAAQSRPPAARSLHLIDLHRMQIRRRTPWRWRRKDLASLCYSARQAGASARDELLFLRVYADAPLRDLLRQGRWHAVGRRARALHRKGVRKGYHP